MEAIPVPCQPIADQLRELESDIKELQDSLAEAIGNAKSAIVRAIEAKTRQRDTVNKQLHDCILQNQPLPVPPPAPPTHTVSLRVATFNLWMSTRLQDDDKWYWSGRFRYPVTLTNNQRLWLISQFLNDDLRPDICFFQEVDNGTDRSKLSGGIRVNQAAWLSAYTSLKYWVFDAERLDYQWGQVGNAILTRFPIYRYTSHYIPGTDYGTAISDIYI